MPSQNPMWPRETDEWPGDLFLRYSVVGYVVMACGLVVMALVYAYHGWPM